MIKSNTCPYCGGPYTVASSCNGRRTDTPGENACDGMRLHERIVRTIIAIDERMDHEQAPDRLR